MTHPTTARLAVYAIDPPALDAFHVFDPESLVVMSAIYDALVHIDAEGRVAPGLATEWQRVSPLAMDFELRQGVQFHDGEAFDADSVVETFRAHSDRELGPTLLGKSMLSPVSSCTRLGPHRVRIETHFPDGMLLHRLTLVSLYPSGPLKKHGREHFLTNANGTGAYRLEHWHKGREIVLTRNPEHWAKRATVDQIRIPIIRQNEWVDCLARGEIDIAWNVDSHDAVRASRIEGLRSFSREAAISQWFLLANRGALADVRVRRALNHALNRTIIADVAEHGRGKAKSSVATAEQHGYAPDIQPFHYSPELAVSLLREAGYGDGFALRGLVSEASTGLYLIVKEFLSRIGVRLDAEIVPRGEWVNRVIVSRFSGNVYDGDFTVVNLDNFVLHSLFHQYLLLHSHGASSITNDAEFDQRFLNAATQVDEPEASLALRALEHFAHDQALMLFTVQQQVHAVARDGFSVTLPRSGHFDTIAFWDLRCAGAGSDGSLRPPRPTSTPDLELLVDATSHTGSFHLRAGSSFADPAASRVWSNLTIADERWRLQTEPMIRELVRSVEAKNHLANILGSTDRVAIAGYSKEGRCLFQNSGYERMLGLAPPYELLDGAAAGVERWDAIRAQVDATGSWQGPVNLPSEGLPSNAPKRLYLAVAPALNEEAVAIGYTFVFSDFSGEEERIRHEATRAILDNVPYGLLRCDRDGNVMDGYSTSCSQFFTGTGPFAGKPLASLLGLNRRSAAHFECCYAEIIADQLPEEVNLGQLPSRLRVDARYLSVSGSIIRDDEGKVAFVLVTLLEITQLIEAEREVEHMKGVLQVMRYRSSFEGFVNHLDRTLVRLAQADPSPERESVARRELHTAKGVLAQFGLMELSRAIHEVEDQPVISSEDLRGVRAAVQAMLSENEPVWGITTGVSSTRYTLSEATLAQIEAELAQADSLDVARSVIGEALKAIREKTVAELVGPMQEACRQHATRVGKLVRLEIEGGEQRCPARLDTLFTVLPHLLFNAIDHGIETPEERGEKAEVASIRIAVRRTGREFEIVVSDDGGGIDIARVTALAIERGHLTADQVAGMTSREQSMLVCLPSLSTRESLSQTSGRGVGMNAVKVAVESLGGVLEIESSPGKGTRVTLRATG